MTIPKRVAIVGAGIGGLGAAHRLTELAAERGTALELVILEASERPGGALASETFEGALLERGPDTLVTHKPAGLALVERLGLGGRLIYPPAGRIEVLQGEKLKPLPAGIMGVRGGDREAFDPEMDESVAAHLRRRLGAELAQLWAEPVIGGLYMADTEHLSFAVTLPRSEATAGGPAPSPFATLSGGLGQIVDALGSRLPPGALHLCTAVTQLSRAAREYRLELVSGEALNAAAVILAVPAHAAARLVAGLDSALADELGRLTYASCATVHLAWPRSAITHLPQANGFFVPRAAGLELVAANFVSTKFPKRVPPDLVLVRAFLGGALHPDVLEHPDDELAALAARALMPLLGTREAPAWHHVARHPHSMPQRKVGHLGWVRNITRLATQHPGLALAGGPTGAYGLPDSIASGEAAAERAWDEVAGGRAL